MAGDKFGRRILILAAHPDDEVVACAAAIGHAKECGAEIFALYLTDGCLARETMWPWRRAHHAEAVARRRREAEAAADRLGIERVGWMMRPTRRLWRELPEVDAEIRAAIEAHAPDQLWVPAYEGGNPDHDALNALGAGFAKAFCDVMESAAPPHPGATARPLGRASLDALWRPPSPASDDRFAIAEGRRDSAARQKPVVRSRERGWGEGRFDPSADGSGRLSVLEFAEYNFFGGRARAQEFPFATGDEQTIVLATEERRRKRELLRLYASERGNLNYVGVERECFRPVAVYDYSQPPHPGALWYARFQWVPFRHPRVDFTPPDEVSRAIVAWRSKSASIRGLRDAC